MPRTSSSATDTDMTGMSLALTPASLSCLKNATLLSPLRVLKTASGSASLTFVMSVPYSVWPSGVYSSPTISMSLAAAHALISLLAVRGKT